MRSFFLLFTYLLLLSLPLDAQLWKFMEFENSSPTERLLSMKFISPSEGWVAGTLGSIYHTHDGGNTWEDQSISDSVNIYTIDFVSSMIGYLISDQGIFASSNGGKQWKLVNNEIKGRNYRKSIGFADENIGWAIENFRVYKTTDRGESWQLIDAQEGFTNLSHVYPVGKDTCFLGGNVGNVLATFDGGKNWSRYVHPYRDQDVSNIHLFDNCTWQFFGYASFSRTNDCGESFYTKKRRPIGRASIIDEKEMWILNAVGGNRIYQTLDSGNTWQARFIGNFTGLTDFHFETSQLAWLAGNHGTVLKTDNGGNTWGISHTKAPKLNSVNFVNHDIQWAVGDKGSIYSKRIDKREWFAINTPIQSNLNDLYFKDDQKGWVVGNSGIILSTSNGGLDWEIISLPEVRADLNAISFKDNFGIIVGDQGTILLSDDFGISWKVVPTEVKQNLMDALITENERFISIGQSGTFLFSDEQGVSWRQVQQFDTLSLLQSIHFSSPLIGWLISKNGKIYKTYDGGESWFQHNSLENVILNDLFFTSEESGWIVGDKGVILGTIDGGETWVRDEFNIEVDLRSISFFSPGSGYIVGDNGTFLRHLQFPVSSENIELKKDVILYPNPTHNFLNIQIEDAKFIERIQFINLAGRSVREFNNVNATTMEVDVSNFVKGIYIVSITYDGKTVSKRVIIQ